MMPLASVPSGMPGDVVADLPRLEGVGGVQDADAGVDEGGIHPGVGARGSKAGAIVNALNPASVRWPQ